MEKTEHNLSLSRVLWTDYPSFYAFLVPFVAWIIYAAWAPDWGGQGAMIKPEMKPVFFAMASLVTIAALIVLAYRLCLLRHVFKFGVQVKGKISNFELKRDRGRIEYTYIFDHQEFFASSLVHRNAQTKSLKPNETVTLVVDPTHPTRAFISHLYTRP